MGYRRAIAPAQLQAGERLTADLVAIGCLFAAEPAAVEPNIEDTVLAASIEGVDGMDFRVLALLVTWLGVHSAWLNADRLTALIRDQRSARVRAFWAAIAHWLSKDHRFARMAKVYSGKRLALFEPGNDFQLKRHGEDLRFAGSPLLVPASMLRDRKGDVLTPPELARRHRAYRWRIVMGPSYRADMWTALEADPSLSAAELARRAYGSFATAWKVRRDWRLVADMATAPR